jgi:hypothetical protein
MELFQGKKRKMTKKVMCKGEKRKLEDRMQYKLQE